MIQNIANQTETNMKKRLEVLQAELMKLRTGRAHSSMLDHVRVDYYGSPVPISQVASFTVSDPRALSITPYDKSMLKVIEKAILTSDLGLNPQNDGNIIRIPMPPLTEERRKEMVKIVKGEGEHARVSIRNLRRDANEEAKKLLKKKEISEDDERRAETDIQKLTDKYISEIDKILIAKEKDLMTV